jgi:pimeloyl-ACP methyl ester carboxylesterase
MWQIALIRASLKTLSVVSPNAASRVAMELFRTPRRFATPDRELELMTDGEPLAVPFGDGARIQAWSWGAGPIVILLHGWEGRGSQMATFVSPLVRAGFRVIAFDAPGHGQSSGRKSSLPQFMSALCGVVEAVGAPAAMIGHSLGCAAATLAIKEGVACEKLVFIAPPLDPAAYTKQFSEILGVNEQVISGMLRRIEERFGRRWSDYSLAAAAPQMKSKLLVIHDRDDADTPWSGSTNLVELWPGAELITTETLGHRRILRDPRVIEAAVHFVSNAEQC